MLLLPDQKLDFFVDTLAQMLIANVIFSEFLVKNLATGYL